MEVSSFKTMAFLSAIGVALTGGVRASELAPNPNPAGETLVVPHGQDVTNGSEAGVVFDNHGAIEVHAGGSLTNANSDPPYWYGEIHNHADASISVAGTFTNWDVVTNDTDAQFTIETGGVANERWFFSNRGEIANYGTFNVLDWQGEPGSLHCVAGSSFVNYALATVNVTSGKLINAGQWLNHGQLNIGHEFRNSGDGFTNEAGGKVSVTGELSNTGTLATAGEITVEQGASIADSSSTMTSVFSQTAGVTTVSGELQQDIVELSGGMLTGTGTVSGDVTISGSGEIAPGLSCGTLQVDGAVNFAGGGLAIEIMSPTERDVLEVTGPVAIASAQVHVSFLQGYVPALGQTFEYLTATGEITGEQDMTVTSDGLPMLLRCDVEGASGTLTVRVEAFDFLPGDANFDGVVNLDDFIILKTSFGEPGSWQQGDFDGDQVVGLDDFIILKKNFGYVYSPTAGDTDLDGDVDLADFNVLKSNFNVGTCWEEGDFDGNGIVDLKDFNMLKTNFTGRGGAIPEPVSALMLLLGVGAMTLKRR